MNVIHRVTDEGGVFCDKEQTVVDVISCYACDRVVTIDLDSRLPRVVCAASEEATTAGRPAGR